MHSLKPVTTLVVLSFFISGCSSSQALMQWEPKAFTPTPLLSQESRVILLSHRENPGTIGETGYTLESVDGIDVSVAPRDQTVYINPGNHIVGIRGYHRADVGTCRVTLTAVAGERYQANGAFKGDRILMWLESPSTGQKVSTTGVYSPPKIPWYAF